MDRQLYVFVIVVYRDTEDEASIKSHATLLCLDERTGVQTFFDPSGAVMHTTSGNMWMHMATSPLWRRITAPSTVDFMDHVQYDSMGDLQGYFCCPSDLRCKLSDKCREKFDGCCTMMVLLVALTCMRFRTMDVQLVVNSIREIAQWYRRSNDPEVVMLQLRILRAWQNGIVERSGERLRWWLGLAHRPRAPSDAVCGAWHFPMVYKPPLFLVDGRRPEMCRESAVGSSVWCAAHEHRVQRKPRGQLLWLKGVPWFLGFHELWVVGHFEYTWQDLWGCSVEAMREHLENRYSFDHSRVRLNVVRLHGFPTPESVDVVLSQTMPEELWRELITVRPNRQRLLVGVCHRAVPHTAHPIQNQGRIHVFNGRPDSAPGPWFLNQLTLSLRWLADVPPSIPIIACQDNDLVYLGMHSEHMFHRWQIMLEERSPHGTVLRITGMTQSALQSVLDVANHLETTHPFLPVLVWDHEPQNKRRIAETVHTLCTVLSDRLQKPVRIRVQSPDGQTVYGIHAAYVYCMLRTSVTPPRCIHLGDGCVYVDPSLLDREATRWVPSRSAMRFAPCSNQPPTFRRRWLPPNEAESFTETIQLVAVGPVCSVCVRGCHNQECDTLNIFQPRTRILFCRCVKTIGANGKTATHTG